MTRPDRKPVVIVLTGPKGAGKTEAASYIEDVYGAFRVNFADPIKAMLTTLGLPWNAVHGSDKESPLEILGGETYRRAATSLGTAWGQSIFKKVWARSTVEKMLQRVAQSDGKLIFVIDDLRFPHELDEIFRVFQPDNVQVVRISNPRTKYPHFRYFLARHRIGRWLLCMAGSDIHQSEAYWPTFPADNEVYNDPTGDHLSDLHEQIDAALNWTSPETPD